MSFRRLSLCFTLAILFVSSLFAQSGSIQGVVLDAAGATVPNAKVVALDQEKQLVARETTTGSDGAFALRPLLPGRYSVKVEAAGFKTLDRTDLVLDANQVMALGSLSLEVGQTTESVTVQAEVPLVDTDTAQRGFTVTSRQVTQLPLNGRDFTSLMRTLPGVVTQETSDFRLAFNNTDQFNVNGLRGSMNNVFLDGSINTDVGANDGQYTQISLDAVGEFRVQTSTFNAEYGRNPGVMISITTKAGSREFHGTVYDFLRNDALDANSFFNNKQGRGKSKLRFNQFGGNISGPIIIPRFSSGENKKLFFFVNYEGSRATRPASNTTFVNVPHADLLNGDLSRLYRPGNILDDQGRETPYRNGQVFRPGTLVRGAGGRIIGGDPYPNNVIPSSQWARNTPGFLNVLKLADRTAGVPLAANPEQVQIPLVHTYKFDKDAWVARIDYNISPNANFFFRWADDDNYEENNRGIFGTTPYPIFPQYRAKPGASWSWNLVNVISPTITNEAIFTYNHLTQVVDIVPDTDPSLYDREALGFTFTELYPDANFRNRFPRFNCGVGSCDFGGFASGWLSEGKTYAFTDTISVIRGAHALKFGIFWNQNRNGQQPAWTDAINIDFNPSVENPGDTGNRFANMLLGNYTSITQSNGIFYGDFRFNGFEWFAQDSWKINRRFTLEYGIRWAWMGPTYTLGQYLQNYFDPRAYDPAQAVRLDLAPGLRQGSIIPNSGNPFNGMIEEGTEGFPKGGMKNRYNNWGPRLGFAWDVTGDGKTAVRGGGGIFYERIRQNNLNFDGLGNPPLVYNPRLYGSNVDAISPSLVAAGGVRFPVSIRGHDEEGQIPTIYAWSLGIQRELPGDTSIDVAYVGNAARHLMYQRNLNHLPLGTSLAAGFFTPVNGVQNAVRPYQGYQDVTWTEFGGISNYNALQTRVSRRFGRSFTANANYTWSKAMGEVDNDTTTIGYFLDRAREYGPLGFDRTHTFTLDWIYEFPRLTDSNAAARLILGGWQLAGIARFWTGRPINITADQVNAGTLGGSSGARANYLGGEIYTKTADEWFNPLVFGRPAEGNLGNLGKNALRGPGVNQWDISLYKTTRITERVSTQFRLETFNTFNHTQFAALNTGISAANPNSPVTAATRGQSGVITDTRDPRSLQLALKLLF
jgi:hypothetical protein